MKILTSLNGIFPRSPQLINATRKYEHREISIEELEKAYEIDYNNLKKLTQEFEFQSDGLLNWQDLLRPFEAFIKDAKATELIRYCETNKFYRKVILPTQLNFRFEKFFNHFFRFGNTAFLPSVNLFRKYSNANCENIVVILTETIKFLFEKKYKYFVLQDPLIMSEDTKDATQKLISILRKILSNKVIIGINTFFKQIAEELPYLLAMDIDFIGIDFNKNSLQEIQKIKWKNDKGIFAGILNTDTTLLEEISAVKSFLNNLISDLKPPFVIISGAPDFEFLTTEYAIKKIEILKKVKKSIANGK